MKFELKFEGYKNKQADIVYQIVFRRRFSTADSADSVAKFYCLRFDQMKRGADRTYSNPLIENYPVWSVNFWIRPSMRQWIFRNI